MTHELFEELDAFDRHWQLHYRTILDAARAAKVLIMYSEWLGTDEGMRYREVTRDVPDTARQNELERALRERCETLGSRYARSN